MNRREAFAAAIGMRLLPDGPHICQNLSDELGSVVANDDRDPYFPSNQVDFPKLRLMRCRVCGILWARERAK